MVRDARVVEKYPLVLLESGILFILDSTFELLKTVRVSDSFFDKPAIPLEIQQTYFMEETIVSVQESSKWIKMYRLQDLLKGKSESLTGYQDQMSNAIIDYQIIQDWRRASEESEDAKLPESILVATLTLE